MVRPNFMFTPFIFYDKPDAIYLFKDLTDKSWAYEFVKFCKDNGIIQGYPDGTFRPDAPITRAEMCAMLYRYHQTFKPSGTGVSLWQKLLSFIH
jgi:hypothetical protein